MSGQPDLHSVDEALQAERQHLRPDDPDPELQLTALCLSGGGIRSAAFGLGVLQALASGRLLTRFDYLSTVSGGGFIGGWLQVLIQRMGAPGAERRLRDPQAPELVSLRSYTNYLTPQVGPFTSDTWTAVALYLRNLLLNWLVIVPVLLLVVLALILHRTLVATFGRADEIGALPWLSLSLGTALLFAATMRACMMLPSHRPPRVPPAPGRDYASPDAIQRQIVYPTLAWALLMPVALRAWLVDTGWSGTAPVPVSYAIAVLGAYACAWWRQRRVPAIAELFRFNVRAWTIATLLATASLVLGERWYVNLSPGDRAQALTTFAPLALILCHMFQAVIHVGLRQERIFADLDREWIARLDGTILLYTFAWTAFSLCCLDLAALLIPADGRPFGTAASWAVGLMTVVTGPGVAWVGKQAIARVEKGLASTGVQISLRRALDLFSAVFAVGLFAYFGVTLQYLLGFVQIRLGIGGPGDARISVFLLLLGLQILFGMALFWLSYAFSRVNVNRFSLHGVYRNRLSRAFLGSALEDRHAEPFTGFSPEDNPRLAGMAGEPGERRLFPIINMALNLTATTHTAWAERKAASFTATPLACGSAELEPAGGGRGAYVNTADFAGASSPYDVRGARLGIRLGTALTISGAAVSPNWGYNSSPLTAFLMTLFNVRLGAWLPNPARSTEAELRLSSPRNSQRAIFDELLGVTTDRRQSIYLSDGGHFENLGMYEALRRECSHLLVVDAGQDPKGEFTDLGNAIRKASIDGLAEITMQKIRILSRAALEADHHAGSDALGLAVGTITYASGRTGRMIYLKP
ncbi:MAG TPA: patatin-like phospholipase family protein, partial [Acetobacteraceae bacterium]|nr:patatin-like phospholipase family protein [Acetobacteraceae bacterium]